MTMGNFFSKPLIQVDASDILDLMGAPEGQVFEIKSKLPADKKSHDPWYDEPESGKPRNGPGDNAKQDIFKEVVAFANSEGGWLVLGLTETSDHPKRAKGVDPLPDCHELADRFQRAAYDWIDPPLPSLQCRGIEIGDIPGKGVIAFRVPRSLDAPHRVNKKDRQAYRRISDESKPMKMREIQGMTLDMARGQERIDREFDNARKRYLEFKPKESPKRKMTGFNLTLVPLSGPLMIDRPYLQKSIFERKIEIEGIFQGKERKLKTIDAGISTSISPILPILRGGKKIWYGTYSPPHQQPLELEEDFIILLVFDSGIIQISTKRTFDKPPGISLDWIITDIANALCIMEQARIIGGMPDTEYAMEVELRHDELGVLRKTNLYDIEFQFGLLNEDDFHFSRKLGPGPLLLPRYPVGGSDDFLKILKFVMDDLYNAVGKPHIDDFEFCPIC